MILRPYLVIKKTSRGVSYRVTKTPTYLDADEIAMRLELNLPDSLFSKPTLEAKITIPASAVSTPVISAEVKDNIEDVIKNNTGINIKLIQVEDDEL